MRPNLHLPSTRSGTATYPYSTLSIVVPPKGGNGAGGMEYPTLITAFAAENDNPGYDLERTVVHEIGHQYWYGMVASNEFEEAWLDEGFTSYAEDKVMESEYGVEPNLPVEASYMTDPAPLKQLSWSYHSHNNYAENVYMRAKLVLIRHREAGRDSRRCAKSCGLISKNINLSIPPLPTSSMSWRR